MFSMKKYAKVFLLTLVLLFVLSSAASAAAPTIDYVYYQRASDEKIIKVNYQSALNQSPPQTLYQNMINGISYALTNGLDVWVKIADGKVYHYSEAIYDNVDHEDIFVGDTYLEDDPAVYNPDFEMYLDDFNRVKIGVPSPEVQPGWWIDDDAVWVELLQKWRIEVTIDPLELPGGALIGEISSFKIKGEIATRIGTTNAWHVFISGSKTSEPVLEPGDVMILIKSTWHY